MKNKENLNYIREKIGISYTKLDLMFFGKFRYLLSAFVTKRISTNLQCLHSKQFKALLWANPLSENQKELQYLELCKQ